MRDAVQLFRKDSADSRGAHVKIGSWEWIASANSVSIIQDILRMGSWMSGGWP